MKLLPREELTYQTNQSGKTVLQQLADLVEPPKAFRIHFFWQKKKAHKPYQGKIEGNQFEISRIISYRNSFLPQIKGIITHKGKQTQIDIRMELNPFVKVFAIAWCVGIALFFGSILFYAISNGNFTPIILIPLLLIIFMVGMTWGGFLYESKKAKQAFEALWGAPSKV